MYSVKLTPHAKKQYDKLPSGIKLRIKNGICEIKPNPYLETKKLKGSLKYPIFSLRIGDYRVIMRIQNKELVILIIDIGERKKVYKKY